MEEDWVEEEFVCYVDFGEQLIVPKDEELQFDIIGLTEEHPICEVNGKHYSGTFEYALGTKLFFAKDNEPSTLDPVFDRRPDQMYRYAGKTNKVLRMERLHVREKSADGEPDAEKVDEEPQQKVEAEDEALNSSNKFTVTETYQEALEKLLKPGTYAPRTVSNPIDAQVLIRREVESTLPEQETDSI